MSFLFILMSLQTRMTLNISVIYQNNIMIIQKIILYSGRTRNKAPIVSPKKQYMQVAEKFPSAKNSPIFRCQKCTIIILIPFLILVGKTQAKICISAKFTYHLTRNFKRICLWWQSFQNNQSRKHQYLYSMSFRRNVEQTVIAIYKT